MLLAYGLAQLAWMAVAGVAAWHSEAQRHFGLPHFPQKGASVADLEIACVEWREDSHDIDITYLGGASKRLVGSKTVAAAMAEGAGLWPVQAADGIYRWV